MIRNLGIAAAVWSLAVGISLPAAAQASGSAGGTVLEIPGERVPSLGTLVDGGADAPIVLIIPGPKFIDRDGNSQLGHKTATYARLADRLSERGIGSIRIGIGTFLSTWPTWTRPEDVTIDAHADDVEAWIPEAIEHGGGSCVWLLGHHMGGIVAMAAAARGGPICGVILAGMPARSYGDVLRDQFGANRLLEKLRDDAVTIIEALERGETVDVAPYPNHLQNVFGPDNQAHLNHYVRHHPTEMISRLSGPILILHGDRDLAVLETGGARLRDANPDAELIVIPGMNSFLKPVSAPGRKANTDTYGDPDLPLAAGVVDAIETFIRARSE